MKLIFKMRFLLCLAAVLPVFASAQLPSNLQPLMDEGVKYAFFEVDYPKAVAAFEQIVAAIPDNHLSNRPLGVSEFAEAQLYLGVANYRNGQYFIGSNQMLKAMEMNLGWANRYAIHHFDTLIAKGQVYSSLYVARALAYMQYAPYQGWGDSSQRLLEHALEDLDSAEKLGFTDFRINLYRGLALYKMWWVDFDAARDRRAYEQLSMAIQKAPNDPRAYFHRSHLNSTSRLNDPTAAEKDRQTGILMSKSWSFRNI